MTTTVLWWSGLEHLVGVLGTRSITAKRSRGFYEYFLISPLWPCGGGVRPCGLNSLVAFGARSMSSPKVSAVGVQVRRTRRISLNLMMDWDCAVSPNGMTKKSPFRHLASSPGIIVKRSSADHLAFLRSCDESKMNRTLPSVNGRSTVFPRVLIF